MRAVRAHHDLLKAISQSKNSRQAAVERRRFLRDPHRFAKRLLSPPVTGKPSFAKAIADDYFREAYSDCDRSYSYQPPFDMPRPARPKHSFDIKFATLEERFAGRRVTLLLQVLMVFLIYSTNAVIKFDASSGHFCSEFG